MTWSAVEKANKYIVNINGVEVETIEATGTEDSFEFDTNTYFVDDVTEVTVKIRPICDNNPLVFNGEYSINNPTIYQLSSTSTYTLTKNADDSTTISWASVDHATKYVVEIYKVGVADAIITETVNSNSYTLDDTYTDSYKIRVRAEGASNTLAGEFGEYFEFNKKDVSELTVNLVDGVVSYSIDELDDCKVVFYIVDDTTTHTVEKTELSGTFNVSDTTTSTSYLVYARLVPNNTASVLVSNTVKVGHSYELTLTNNEDYSSTISWTRLNTATSYNLVITKGGTTVVSDTVDNSENPSFTIPNNLEVGEFKVVISVNNSISNIAGGDSKELTFNKLDVTKVSTTYTDNVLSLSSTDANIVKVAVYVAGTASEKIEVELPGSIDFKEKGYASGTYTFSIQALPVTTSNYISSNVAAVTGAQAYVITNPTVVSVSSNGLVTWNTNSDYAEYNVYIDKGSEREVSYMNRTGNSVTINIAGISSGEHTVSVVAIPVSGYISTDTTTDYTFVKLSTVSNIRLDNGKVVWNKVEKAGGYEIYENNELKGVITGESYTPTTIKDVNNYTIRPLGNNVDSISSETATTATFNKLAKVEDLNIVDGVLTWTKEEGFTYTLYVDGEAVPEGYEFAGLAENQYAETYVKVSRAGFFDSDISNIFYVKKLAKVTGITVTSTDKFNYTIAWNAVTGATSYVVYYGDTEYPVNTNKLDISGPLTSGNYTITVRALSAGSEPLTDGTKKYNYLSGDISEEKAFTKLGMATNLGIVDGKLKWNAADTAVGGYEVLYAVNSDTINSWTTVSLEDVQEYDMSFLSAGEYAVKIRAVGREADMISGDYTDQIVIVKLDTIKNLKVLNGVIVWDEVSSDTAAYSYDIKVYTKSGETNVPVGEPVTGHTSATYTIPAMATETKYYIEVRVINTAGVEIPSEYSAALEVIKLAAPTNFIISEARATWTSASYADTTYRIVLTDPNGVELTYDRGAAENYFAIPNDIAVKTKYTIKVMAKGTADSGNTMKGYLHSEYTTTLNLYKLAAIENLRVEDGIIKWSLTHTDSDEYQPFNLLVTLYFGGDKLNSTDITLPRNVTELNISDRPAGNYMIEIVVVGDNITIINSNVVCLGDAEPIKKLATPTSVRMQNGMLVWDSVDTSTEVVYVLYNDGVEFMTTASDVRQFYPTGDSTMEYHISIKAIEDGAIYSGRSEQITVTKLTVPTGFTLSNGKFVWNAVPNAYGYEIELEYYEVPEEDGEETDPDAGVETVGDDEITEGEGEGEGEVEAPVGELKQLTIEVKGGSTTEVAIPAEVPTTYTVKTIRAIGNSTADHTTPGFFTSNDADLTASFKPLGYVEGFTVNDGEFVWNRLEGASYYKVEVLTLLGQVVKTGTTETTRYRVNDDTNVPAGSYFARVTPISTSDTYVTTNLYTAIMFQKLPALNAVRVEDGYLTWSVKKQDILNIMNLFNSTQGPEGGEGEEGGEESGVEAQAEELTWNNDVFMEFYKAALSETATTTLESYLYSLAHINIHLTNSENNKVVRKTAQPFNVVDSPGDYVTCYYFVDVESDTWNIRIGSKGNTVTSSDLAALRFIDGVMSPVITATKLKAPVSPIHYDTTMINEGLLSFMPIIDKDGKAYATYIIEAIPSTAPNDQIITYIYTIPTDELNDLTAREIKVTELGLKYDITYTINIKTYGSANATTDAYLNSDTPVSSALVLLGKVNVSVKEGQISWTNSNASYYRLFIEHSDGSVDNYNVDVATTTFSLDDETKYPAGNYKVKVQAVGDEITRISSDISTATTITKLGKVDSIELTNGSFIWNHSNAGDGGYAITYYRTRENSEGQTIEEYIEGEIISGIDPETSTIALILPNSFKSYVIEGNYTSVWYYGIQIKKLGSIDGGKYVDGNYCAVSQTFRRLNTPTNIRVNNGSIVWNSVSGASGYQIRISGENTDKGINVGSEVSFAFDNEFLPGTYTINVRAVGNSSSYLTSAYSETITIVRPAEPKLRVDRGEVFWNSNEALPIEATAKVKLTINGTELPLIENIDNNISFDFDTEDYPAGTYTIKVQFIGNNELINSDPPVSGGEDDKPAVVSDGLGFYYLSSREAVATFIKLARPSIVLGRIIDAEAGTEYNAIEWDAIPNALMYDVYIVTEYQELQGEDDPETEEDERELVTLTRVEKYAYDDPAYAELFSTNPNNGKPIFKLTEVPYEDYRIYIRAVGDNTVYISSTRSEDIHVHIPLPPEDFRYNDVTGAIEWRNVTSSSLIVLDVKKFNTSTLKYDIDVYPGGKVLPAGTTSFHLEGIGEYQVRIKSRLEVVGGSFDSDYNETTLVINYALFNSGSGTYADPYTVTEDAHVNNIRYFLDRHFLVLNDIDMSSVIWETIGSGTKPFTGTIRGSIVTDPDTGEERYANISGIAHSNQTYDYAAFVHTIKDVTADDGITTGIFNLNFEVLVHDTQESSIVRAQYLSGVAIYNYSEISSVTVSGTINVNGTNSADNAYAGIAVFNYGYIKNVINKAEIRATSANTRTTFTKVGGVVAYNYSIVTESGNEGYLLGQIVGGIASENYLTISKCYNNSNMGIETNGYLSGSISLGGIAGKNLKDLLTGSVGTIDTCYSVFGEDGIYIDNKNNQLVAYAGGIVGMNANINQNAISNCYVIMQGYNSIGNGKAPVVATLVANTSDTSTDFYKVLLNCYAYCTSNTQIFISNGGSTVAPSDLNGTSKYNGIMTFVEGMNTANDIVSINGLTISDGVPILAWQN